MLGKKPGGGGVGGRVGQGVQECVSVQLSVCTVYSEKNTHWVGPTKTSC